LSKSKKKLNQYSKYKEDKIMTVAESINNAISKGDIKSIRIMMKNSLLVDPTFVEFKEMEKLTQNVSGLYDAHDGRELNDDKSAWNDDYMNKLMVQVIRNFSHERLDHLKEVVKYLRPTRVKPKPPHRKDNRGVKIAAGVAGGGMAGGIIAGIAGGSVIIGAVVGAVVVGAVVAVITKRE
jgi:hypothetical protein